MGVGERRQSRDTESILKWVREKFPGGSHVLKDESELKRKRKLGRPFKAKHVLKAKV